MTNGSLFAIAVLAAGTCSWHVTTVASTSSPSAVRIAYVDDSAPPGGDGHSWETAYHRLQDALAERGAFDELRIAQGWYAPTEIVGPMIEPDRLATFRLINDVQHLGGFAGLGAQDPNERDPDRFPTILTGDIFGDDVDGSVNNEENSHHVVTANWTSEDTLLEGVTIRGGHASGLGGPYVDGAGLYNEGGALTIRNCRFENNIAISGHYPNYGSTGGGIYNENATPTIVDCVFDGNAGGASGGGGIYNVASTVKITNCLFENNWVGTNAGGAAMACHNCTVTVTDCVFRNNLGVNGTGPGGVRESNATSSIYLNCVFEGNEQGSRGALSISGWDCTIEGCLFRENTSKGDVGGIRSLGPGPTFIRDCAFIENHAGGSGGGGSVRDGSHFMNCLFQSNSAGERGGGLYVYPDDGDPQISNCVFYLNSAALGGGLFASDDDERCESYSNLTIVQNTATESGGGFAGTGRLANSIVYDNLPDQIDADARPAFCNIQGGAQGFGNFDVEPRFVDASNGDFRLLDDSPCKDRGWNHALATDVFDLDGDGDTSEFLAGDALGQPRIVGLHGTGEGCGPGPIVDVGAYEIQVGEAMTYPRGDINSDRVVDVDDLLAVIGAVGTILRCDLDLNLNGVVDVLDVVIVLQHWGQADK